MKNQCPECNKKFDISKKISASCRTCDKKHMCIDCCYTHECIEGSPRQLHIVSNREWISDLKKTLKTQQLENVRNELDKN